MSAPPRIVSIPMVLTGRRLHAVSGAGLTRAAASIPVSSSRRGKIGKATARFFACVRSGRQASGHLDVAEDHARL